MTRIWSNEHRGIDWQDKAHRVEQACERDEYPPAYVTYYPSYIHTTANGYSADTS
jgi:hypothetical protein